MRLKSKRIVNNPISLKKRFTANYQEMEATMALALGKNLGLT